MISKTRFFMLGMAMMILGAALATAQPGPDGKGKGPGGKGKKGKGPPPAVAAPDPAQVAFDKLSLSGSLKDRAQEIVDAHIRTTRKMAERTNLDFLNQVQKGVSEAQFVIYKDAVNNPQGGQGRITSTDMVEHVMAFDKGKIGKVSREELPERLQHLLDKGDLNKDGYLDREEVQVLAIKGQNQKGKGKGKGKGPDGGGKGFDGKGKGFDGKGKGPGFGPGPGGVRVFTPADAEKALSRVQLTGAPQEKTRQAIDVYKEASRKMTEERRTDLIMKMKEVLDNEQLQRFSESLGVRGAS